MRKEIKKLPPKDIRIKGLLPNLHVLPHQVLYMHTRTVAYMLSERVTRGRKRALESINLSNGCLTRFMLAKEKPVVKG